MIKIGSIEKFAAEKFAAERISSSLAKLAKDFRNFNEHDLAETTLLAIAAVSGVENPNSDITFSYVMRQVLKVDKKKSIEFFKQFKESADSAYLQGVNPEEIESIALMDALQKLDILPEEIHDTQNV